MHNQSIPLPLMAMRTKKTLKIWLMLSMGHLSMQYGTSLYTGGRGIFYELLMALYFFKKKYFFKENIVNIWDTFYLTTNPK